jgi:hypothetical protein
MPILEHGLIDEHDGETETASVIGLIHIRNNKHSGQDWESFRAVKKDGPQHWESIATNRCYPICGSKAKPITHND